MSDTRPTGLPPSLKPHLSHAGLHTSDHHAHHIRPAQDSTLVDPLVGTPGMLRASDPMLLIDDGEVDAVADHQKKIRSYEEGARHRTHDWKRQPHVTGAGPVRMKSFHGKYSDQGLAFLDDTINEWQDGHPEV
ncbi:MAG: hypothetical protein H7144_08095, partial [Burkholderiales bacterium]|nr:hypothetical protein [Phycisphaerae bacterium]